MAGYCVYLDDALCVVWLQAELGPFWVCPCPVTYSVQTATFLWHAAEADRTIHVNPVSRSLFKNNIS
jgi:hypothetical protein